jgi:hypothetical protein
VKATSVQDPSKNGTSAISVTAASTLSASLNANPSSGNAPLGVTLTANAGTSDLVDTFNYSVWWDCTYAGNDVAGATAICGDPNIATIGQKFNGIAAPSEIIGHSYNAGTHHPKVIIEQGAFAPATAGTTVTVTNASGITAVSVVCNPLSISIGGTSTCTPTVIGTGAYNPAVTWSVTGGGTISATGVYTGPAAPTNATVKATSVQDPTKNGTAPVVVTPPPPVCTFSAAPTTIIIPQQSTLSWSCQNAVTCSISPTVGSVSPVAGSTKVSPSAQTTYTLTCNGVGSTSLTQSVIVKVSGPGVHETNP